MPPRARKPKAQTGPAQASFVENSNGRHDDDFYRTPGEVTPALPAITFQTPLQNGLTISDLPGPTGGIMLKSATGATLIVNDTGIYIQNGKGASITLLGPSVTINNGALMVT